MAKKAASEKPVLVPFRGGLRKGGKPNPDLINKVRGQLSRGKTVKVLVEPGEYAEFVKQFCIRFFNQELDTVELPEGGRVLTA